VQVNLVESALVNRFSDAVRKLGQIDNAKVLLAVSGGPDSLALLVLANATMPDRIVAATVDHQLRASSAEEAEYVAGLCALRSIPHYILRPVQPISGNLQSEARKVRYALLVQAAVDAGCDLIATAHHADDQLETLLMRLSRGSGIDGMSGIRPRNGNIIRPLLEFCKSELEGICNSACLEPVRDPSNEDSAFDRVAVRQWLSRAPNMLKPLRANRTASALQDAGTALDWVTQRLATTHIQVFSNNIQCDANDLPHELQRRLLLLSLRSLAPMLSLRGDTLDRLINDLIAGKTTTVGNILCKGGVTWSFTQAPPRQGV
jgi:tRNA(Ile)-lysidine synthase